MDQPDLERGRHAHALAGLARLNFLSRSSAILFRPLVKLQQKLGKDKLRILDVASGAGDIPIRLWTRAAASGLDWRISGCDISPVAVEYARKAALEADVPVRFFVHDALVQPLPGPFDAVTCSLFLHHLETEQAVALLRSIARLADGGPMMVLVNDLDRSLRGLVLAYLATRLLTTSRVVHTDGPRSVRAAFTMAEARGLAEEAGLSGAVIGRRWPCRWLLNWSRPS